MEDRYLYRAKKIDDGKWVIGNLIQSRDATDGWEAIIIPVKNSNMFCKHIGHGYGNLGFENWYRVDASTICQCTGLTDKNGKLIWENDIVNYEDFTLCQIVFADYSINWGWCKKDIKSLTGYISELYNTGFSEFDASNCKVVGNIFDNNKYERPSYCGEDARCEDMECPYYESDDCTFEEKCKK